MLGNIEWNTAFDGVEKRVVMEVPVRGVGLALGTGRCGQC